MLPILLFNVIFTYKSLKEMSCVLGTAAHKRNFRMAFDIFSQLNVGNLKFLMLVKSGPGQRRPFFWIKYDRTRQTANGVFTFKTNQSVRL